jgi:hypothetical protein
LKESQLKTIIGTDMKYFKSKGDRAMSDLSDAYGQIVEENTITSYDGGIERQVVQELAPIAAVAPVAIRAAAKYAPKIAGAAVKGAKSLMPGAKAAAKQVGKAAVAGAAQGVQQRVQNKVAGQQQQQQEQEEEFGIGMYVDIEDRIGGGTGEIVGIVSNPPNTFVVQTDDDETLHVKGEDISAIERQYAEVDTTEDIQDEWLKSA